MRGRYSHPRSAGTRRAHTDKHCHGEISPSLIHANRLFRLTEGNAKTWPAVVTWTQRFYGNKNHKPCRDSWEARKMSHRAFSKHVCEDKRDFDEMKNAAAEFYRVSRVPQDMERALHQLFLHRPADLHGYLVGLWASFCPCDVRKQTNRRLFEVYLLFFCWRYFLFVSIYEVLFVTAAWRGVTVITTSKQNDCK